jgi:ABC-2 type transport system ATP-binding protein
MGEGSGGLVVSRLSKEYGAKRVVDDVSFSCRRGSVTGFIGPNGSGKSTTLRMIVGHARPTTGTALFDGAPLPELPRPGRAVGVLLDASAHHPGRSVFETAYLAGFLVGVGKARVRDCLAAVGVDGVRHKRVGSLSLGMRQRMGIAIAVLGSPDYLILDEPANGLDPEGIHWLRQFLRSFADKGGCALVSSHQLNELESASDAIVVIDRGRLLDLNRDKRAETVFRVSCRDDRELRRLLIAADFAVMSGDDGVAIRVAGDPELLSRYAADHDLPLRLLAPVEDTLESQFLKSTRGEFAGLSGARLGEIVRGGSS